MFRCAPQPRYARPPTSQALLDPTPERVIRSFQDHGCVMRLDTSSGGNNKLGISAFVAHEDIELAKEWWPEIESALASMDGLVPLLALVSKRAAGATEKLVLQ